jgi:thiol-disulfide isomerase/thioredoxin
MIKENKPIILYFYDKDSIGCKLATPIVKRAKYEYGDKINFILVNINNRDNSELVELYKIENVPAYIVLNANKNISMSAPNGYYYLKEGYFELFYGQFSENPNYIHQTGKIDWKKVSSEGENYGDLIESLP